MLACVAEVRCDTGFFNTALYVVGVDDTAFTGFTTPQFIGKIGKPGGIVCQRRAGQWLFTNNRCTTGDQFSNPLKHR